MKHLSMPILLAAAAALTGCATTQQQRGINVAAADCAGIRAEQATSELYAPGKISNVEPIYRTEQLTRATQRKYVIGANLYVPAEQGVTEAYLERVLSCHAVSRNDGHPNDPLRVQGVVDVDVERAGPSLRVAITGSNRHVGDSILQRARALHQGQGDVSVEQLSALETTPNL